MTIFAIAALAKMAGASLLAGVGVSVVFSVVVYGLVRSSDMRRVNRGGAAFGYAVTALIALVISAAFVALGLFAVVHKH